MGFMKVALLSALATASTASVVERRQSSSVTLFPPVSGTPTIASACESVSSVWASFSAIGATATAQPTYVTKPSLALACLQSVPVDVENDVALIDYLLPFVSWQSTLAYLKDPPEGYLLPGVDVIAGMEEIRQKVRDGGYTNQYEFTRDLRGIFQAAADGHFLYQPALNSIFSFSRGIALAAVSSDGLELPKVYWIQDIQGFSSVRPGVSDIVSIDGIDIETYLINSGPAVTWPQDPDAVYNSQFWTIPGVISAQGNGFYAGSYPSLPDASTYEFRNGSTWTVANRALIDVSFAGITTGEELHSVYELNQTTSANKRSTAISDSPALTKRDSSCVTQVGYYPTPVVVHCQGYASGYFLDEDTCVLVLYSFEGDNTVNADQPDLLETRNVTRTLFNKCKATGRTKLIVDVSSNKGGNVFMGHEVYRNLFPKSENWSGARFRAHAGFDWVGQVLVNNSGITNLINDVIDANGEEIDTWDQLYGPVKVSKDYETTVSLYNFSNPAAASSLQYPFTVTGYDPKDPAPSQPFAAEDIVVMTDGFCGSTCTIFTGLMNREAGVRTVAVGGRPMKGPMQAMGAVKGSNVMPWANLQQHVSRALSFESPPDKLQGLLPSTEAPPMLPAISNGQLNWRNAYAKDATDGPPLHFIYEAANCRIFHKASYYNSMLPMWADVAAVAWDGASCVNGSTTNSDGTISDDAVAYSDAVLSKQQPYNGPGSLTNKQWQALATNTTGTDALLGPTITNSTDSSSTNDTPLSTTSASSKDSAGYMTNPEGWMSSLLVVVGCLMLL